MNDSVGLFDTGGRLWDRLVIDMCEVLDEKRRKFLRSRCRNHNVTIIKTFETLMKTLMIPV